MAIGEFGGAPALPGDGGLLFSAPMYWIYEMNQAALNPSRAMADATKLLFKNPLNPLTTTVFGKSVAAACELFERSTRRYSRPEWEISTSVDRRRARAGARRSGVGAPVLPAPAFRAQLRARAAPAAAAPSHRRADVRALRDPAARDGRGVPAQPRRLHHRVAGRAHGADDRRAVRSRRLHRLRDLDSALPRWRRSCRRGLPAVGAGARRGRPHGGGRTIPTCRARWC